MSIDLAGKCLDHPYSNPDIPIRPMISIKLQLMLLLRHSFRSQSFCKTSERLFVYLTITSNLFVKKLNMDMKLISIETISLNSPNQPQYNTFIIFAVQIWKKRVGGKKKEAASLVVRKKTKMWTSPKNLYQVIIQVLAIKALKVQDIQFSTTRSWQEIRLQWDQITQDRVAKKVLPKSRAQLRQEVKG